MFNKVAGDLSGTGNNAAFLTKEQLADEPSRVHLGPREKAYVWLKTNKDEYVFTNFGFVTIKGSTAGVKQNILRQDWRTHAVGDVAFETSGGSMDKDCQLRFIIDRQSVTLDIKKEFQAQAIKFSHLLVALQRLQQRNAELMEMAGKILMSANPLNLADPAQVAATVMSASEALVERYAYQDYDEFFRENIGIMD